MRSKMTIMQLRKARNRIEALRDKTPSILRLDELLEERQISRQLLCNITGIPKTRIDNLVRNKFKQISPVEICVLCAFFNIKIRQLFRGKKAIIKKRLKYMEDLF